MKNEKLIKICEKVLEINKEAKEYVAIFADGPDFCSMKDMYYYIFKDGNGQEELMTISYDEFKLCEKAGIIDEDSYGGFKNRHIYDFITENVELKLKELNEEDEEYSGKKCPKCGCTEFYVNAQVVQKWKVDASGEFIEVSDDCLEVITFPSDIDDWECVNCGYEAEGYVFER